MEVTFETLLFAEDIIVDKETENPSLINIFNNINAREFPARREKLKILADFVLSDTQPHVCCVRITAPDNTVVVQTPDLEVRATEDAGRIRLQLELLGTVFQTPGDHSVAILLDKEEIGKRKLSVTKKAI